MERLKNLKNTLMSCVEAQVGNLQETDTHELGEAIDMIKDLEEAMYYCSITKAMEKAEKEEGDTRYYTRYLPPYDPFLYPNKRDMDREYGRMYYSERQPRNEEGEFMSRRGGGGNGSSSGTGSNSSSSSGGMPGGNMYYTEREMNPPFEMRDIREGRSPMRRRTYMESKELNRDKTEKIKELDRYMKELSEDIVEMIEDASIEEKQMLEKKLSQLTSKVSQLNA